MNDSPVSGLFNNVFSVHNALNCYLFLVIILVLSGVESSSNETLKLKPKIMGESVIAQVKQFEVSLFNFKHPHYCGGAIIHPNWILTSAHCRGVCVNDEFCAVRYATLELKTGQIAPIRLFIAHKGYSKEPFLKNDIALAEAPLDSNFDYSLIPIYPYNIPYKEELTLVGWGWTNTNKGSCSKQLRSAILEQADCPKGISRSFFCAQSNDSTPCHGDSGGSLLYNGQLIGLVGFALKDDEVKDEKKIVREAISCQIGEIVAFTFVARFKQWIFSTIGQAYIENEEISSDFEGWTKEEEILLRNVASKIKLC